MTESCKTCRFWFGGEQVGLIPADGYCHRLPPVGGFHGDHRWPYAMHDDWCGEFERISPAKVRNLPRPPDWFDQFAEDCLVQKAAGRIWASDLYAAYRAWALAEGSRPLTETTFGRRAGERLRRVDARRRYFPDLALREDARGSREDQNRPSRPCDA